MKENNQKKNNTSYFLGATAFIGGIIAAIFLSPWTGKRARNWVSQKSSHAIAEADKMMKKSQSKMRYGAGIAEGWTYKLKNMMNPTERADIDGDLLAQRVRTELGENPLTWDLPRINVNSENFVVSIRGPVKSIEQLHDVERVVKHVKGVRRVINDLRIAA